MDFIFDNIVLEIDGDHHFRQVLNWQNNIQVTERDILKMKKAFKEGYSIIRIYWRDIYNDNHNWKQFIHDVVKLIKQYEFIGLYLNSLNCEMYENHIKGIQDWEEIHVDIHKV